MPQQRNNAPEVFPLPDAPYTSETPVAKIFDIQKGSPVIIDNGTGNPYVLGRKKLIFY